MTSLSIFSVNKQNRASLFCTFFSSSSLGTDSSESHWVHRWTYYELDIIWAINQEPMISRIILKRIWWQLTHTCMRYLWIYHNVYLTKTVYFNIHKFKNNFSIVITLSTQHELVSTVEIQEKLDSWNFAHVSPVDYIGNETRKCFEKLNLKIDSKGNIFFLISNQCLYMTWGYTIINIIMYEVFFE